MQRRKVEEGAVKETATSALIISLLNLLVTIVFSSLSFVLLLYLGSVSALHIPPESDCGLGSRFKGFRRSWLRL